MTNQRQWSTLILLRGTFLYKKNITMSFRPFEGTQQSYREQAWRYFHSFTLPRRIQDENGKYRICGPGEPGGQLYSVWGTGVKDLGEFGLGIGLYFASLLQLSALCALCGLILLASAFHFNSKDYDPNRDPDLSWELTGSAVCSDTKVTLSTGEERVSHQCMFKAYQAILDIVMSLVIALFCVATARFQTALTKAIDEAHQTTQDYSIAVVDPGPNDMDPDEWQRFFNGCFSSYGEVAYVSVLKDNGPLLKALANMRYIKKMVLYEDSKEGGIDADDDADIIGLDPRPLHTRILQAMGIGRDLIYWKKQRAAMREQIEELRQLPYVATRVYVVFNTEAAQRAALQALTTGLIPAMLDVSATVAAEYQFHGNVLRVEEAVEPSEVLYENLHVGFRHRVLQQLVTISLSVLVLVVSYFIIKGVSATGAAGAIVVSLINVALPFALKIITSFENHVDAGDQQDSMFNKLVVARMMNTAVMIYILTDFEDTLEADKLTQVFSILFADALTAPTMRFLDLSGKMNHYVLSKYALTQEKCNSLFTGTKWNLAERYTDITKTLFVSLFYSALMPLGLFVSACAFIVTYWVDKYSLLRTWETPPQLDDQLATRARGYIVFSIFAHLLMSANFYAGWSFDSVCEENGEWVDCDRSSNSFILPRNRGWMSNHQRYITDVYGIGSFVVLIFLLVFYFGSASYSFFTRLFVGQYTAVGSDQGITFFSVENIQTFVPQIKHCGLTTPLLACDLSQLNREHINWIGDYDANNLYSTTDLPGATPEELDRLFSVVKMYPESVQAVNPHQVKLKLNPY